MRESEYIAEGGSWILSLLENGLDYLVSAAELAERDNPRGWKYAILDLANGMELLLKARLDREDWRLLFADPQKADRASLQKGDFISTNFKQTCDRLEEKAKVAIGEADKRNLDALRKLRNRFTHYSAVVDSAAVRSLETGPKSPGWGEGFRQ